MVRTSRVAHRQIAQTQSSLLSSPTYNIYPNRNDCFEVNSISNFLFIICSIPFLNLGEANRLKECCMWMCGRGWCYCVDMIGIAHNAIMTSLGLDTYCGVTQWLAALWIFNRNIKSPKSDRHEHSIKVTGRVWYITKTHWISLNDNESKLVSFQSMKFTLPSMAMKGSFCVCAQSMRDDVTL